MDNKAWWNWNLSTVYIEHHRYERVYELAHRLITTSEEPCVNMLWIEAKNILIAKGVEEIVAKVVAAHCIADLYTEAGGNRLCPMEDEICFHKIALCA